MRRIFMFTCTFMFWSCGINKHLKENEFLVEKNVIKDNGTSIDNAELETYIRQKPNRKILKLVLFNLWLYNQVDQQKMLKKKEQRNLRYDRINAARIKKSDRKNVKRIAQGKDPKKPKLKDKEKSTFRESILEAGEPPVILDTALTKITKNQLQKLVFSRGYFDSHVRDSTVLNVKNKRAKTFYIISKSIPYTIKNIHYKVEDPLLEYFIMNDTINTLIKRQDIYNQDVLEKERTRISDNQLNNGFFYFATEYIHYLVDTNLVGHVVNLTIEIKKYAKSYNETTDSIILVSHPRFYISNVYIIPENLSNFRGKSADHFMKDTAVYNGLKILHNNPLLFHNKDLTRYISISPGQLYQQDLSEETYKGLVSLKAFKSIFIQYIQNRTDPTKLDCYIVCQPLVKQSITLETEGTNTSGNLGVAGSFVFLNKNVLKGAEVLELKLKGSFIAQKSSTSSNTQVSDINSVKDVRNIFNTFLFGPELNFYFPRPLFPFTLFYYKRDFSEKQYFIQPKTIVNLSVNYQSNSGFNRVISTISYGFKFTNATGLSTYEIIPFETYSVKAKLSENFKANLLGLNDFYLLNSFQDHITTLSRISFIFNNQILVKKPNLTYFKMSLSSSGNSLRGLFSATNQKQDSLGRYLITGIPFSQFVKLDVDYRFYLKVRKLGKLVYRLAGGIGKPLKNLKTLPYEQSFFAGGPNSNRAWRARTLGPGSYAQPDSVKARYDKIGNIQLEGNLEYRFHIIKSIYGAWFVDAGNIWLSYNDPNKPNGQFKINQFYKDIAIGSGFGLRYDFSFFIFRLDAAMRIHDPQFSNGNKWVFGKQTIRESGILNFGIGYPF